MANGLRVSHLATVVISFQYIHLNLLYPSLSDINHIIQPNKKTREEIIYVIADADYGG
jgi:hypothetical protein